MVASVCDLSGSRHVDTAWLQARETQTNRCCVVENSK